VWKKSLGIPVLLSGTAILYVAAGALLVLGVRRFFSRDYARVH
jgi:hypothetical protein